MQGLINSTPGYKGGYILAKPEKKITINTVLKALGGTLFNEDFCGLHSGTLKLCVNSVDCSTRSLWKMIQFTVDQFLDQVTLYDLMNSATGKTLYQLLQPNSPEFKE
jgi:Rrf2 family protein